MRFDRRHEARRRFARWTVARRERLLASGVPLSYWSTYEHWLYFLDDGYLPYQIDPSQFAIESLSVVQLTELQALVEESNFGGREPDVLRLIRRLLAERPH